MILQFYSRRWLLFMKKHLDQSIIIIFIVCYILYRALCVMGSNYGPYWSFPLSYGSICSLAMIVYAVLYGLMLLYSIIIIIKVKKKEVIKMKANTIILLVLFVIDAILYFFDFSLMIISSPAIHFLILDVIIYGLLTLMNKSIE